jgi:hypothetical protein
MGTPLAKILIIAGAVLIVAGVVILFADKIPWLGHLPGDITIKRDNYTINIPIVTCLLVSVVLTVLLNVIFRR